MMLFGCAPIPPSAAQLEAAKTKADDASVAHKRAVVAYDKLSASLAKAKETLATARSMNEQLETQSARLAEELRLAEHTYAEAQYNQTAFKAKYPDLYKAARQYVYKHSHAPAYGEAAAKNAIDAKLRDLQFRQKTRDNAVAESERWAQEIRKAIQDNDRRREMLSAAVAAAKRTETDAPKQLVSSQAELARLQREQKTAESVLIDAVESRRRIAESWESSNSTAASADGQGANAAVVCMVLLIAGIFCVTLWMSTTFPATPQAVENKDTVGGAPTPAQRDPTPRIGKPRRTSQSPAAARATRLHSKTFSPWLGWLFALAALFGLFYACTPPSRHSRDFWKTPEGREIRNEQEFYDSQIPRGR